ncbi:MAG TPA: saccharopine dehydrogenase C-terminal domain-containing protein, partial [Chitinophagaceae bacterium]|nr:saccharopine dehydrogenase C-terminal domain-containing protein [Chitinophagaceae bacterium]
MKITVLGAGMVGRAMALDLAWNHDVTVLDYSEASLAALRKRNEVIRTFHADLRQKEHFADWLKDADLVLIAVPGFMGFETVKAVIETGKNIVDISFFPENALELDALAKEKGVTVITDCGVAPGMSNYIIGRYNEEMVIDSFEIYVGGLPKTRKKPFEYKAPFSPVDVIEEYTRPARIMENGHIVVKPALTELEWMEFEGLGTLECFNTDGLRSLLFTMPHITNQKEKTLRYPGHVEQIIALREAGFFSEEPILVNGHEITPMQFTSRILFNEWKLGEDEEELTVMKVIVNGKDRTVTYSMLDRYDTVTGISSMSRSTGYVATATINMLVAGLFNEKGVFPPELVGKHKACFDFVLQYLAERKVIWSRTETYKN